MTKREIKLEVREGPLAGKSFTCHEDAPECSSVVVDGAECPVCTAKVGLVDHRGILRALSGRIGLPKARKATEKEWGPCTVQEPNGEFRVRCNTTPNEDYDTITGPAECARCRTLVGVLTVKVPTMWGLDEDRRVLHGRARVY